jgi:serine/threonine-protein kinase RsbT
MNIYVERTIYISNDLDMVMARMQARQMAKKMGFTTADQARISLATSELARILILNGDDSAKIILSAANKNGRQGIQIVCLFELDQALVENGSRNNGGGDKKHKLMDIRQLMDESSIDPQDDKHTQITLIKWLK